MNEGFGDLPSAPQPEQEESVVEKLKRLGGPENPEFLEAFGTWQDEQQAIAEQANTPRANIEALLAIARMKADLGLTESALDDLNDILYQVDTTEDFADLGGEANRLISSLENQEPPIE